jgi:hypothetical protein
LEGAQRLTDPTLGLAGAPEGVTLTELERTIATSLNAGDLAEVELLARQWTRLWLLTRKVKRRG